MRPLEIEVDLSSGDPGAGGLIELLQGVDVATLARGVPQPRGDVPDGYRYELRVDAEGGSHELDLREGTVPSGLRPVIKDLERRALAELRSRRRT